eukprot:ctg_2997.g469
MGGRARPRRLQHHCGGDSSVHRAVRCGPREQPDQRLVVLVIGARDGGERASGGNESGIHHRTHRHHHRDADAHRHALGVVVLGAERRHRWYRGRLRGRGYRGGSWHLLLAAIPTSQSRTGRATHKSRRRGCHPKVPRTAGGQSGRGGRQASVVGGGRPDAGRTLGGRRPAVQWHECGTACRAGDTAGAGAGAYPPGHDAHREDRRGARARGTDHGYCRRVGQRRRRRHRDQEAGGGGGGRSARVGHPIGCLPPDRPHPGGCAGGGVIGG